MKKIANACNGERKEGERGKEERSGPFLRAAGIGFGRLVR
jgi:hypothetical protein